MIRNTAPYIEAWNNQLAKLRALESEPHMQHVVARDQLAGKIKILESVIEEAESMQSNTMPVQIKIIDERASVPAYATKGSAGLDICAWPKDADGYPLDNFVARAGESVLIHTGISVYIDNPGYAAVLLPRSGLGHNLGIVLGNLVGLIDSDYQGELMVSCWNRSRVDKHFEAGEKISQLVIVPVMQAQFEIVTDFKEKTDRGGGGFGSTDTSSRYAGTGEDDGEI